MNFKHYKKTRHIRKHPYRSTKLKPNVDQQHYIQIYSKLTGLKFAGENFDEIVCFLGVAEGLALVNLGVFEVVGNFEVLD